MLDHYSSDELKSLVRVLNDILAEARSRRPDLSKDEIVQRFFSRADAGERDAGKLHQAVFGTGELGTVGKSSRQSDKKFSVAEMKKAMRASSAPRRYRLA